MSSLFYTSNEKLMNNIEFMLSNPNLFEPIRFRLSYMNKDWLYRTVLLGDDTFEQYIHFAYEVCNPDYKPTICYETS